MLLMIYACITLVLGIGLLLRQNWARTLTILFSMLGFLTLLPMVIHHHPFSVLFALLNLAVFIYLLLPQTRAYFDRKQVTAIKPG